MTEKRTPPTAVCPKDSSPLIFTFERRGKEFYCMACGEWYEFLQPRAMPTTQDLSELQTELSRVFLNGQRYHPCGPTDDDMFCACGCGGDDSRCGLYLTYYARPMLHGESQVPETHTCCKIPGRG